MLLYALVVITAGLLLATAVALLRLHRELRDRCRSAENVEHWFERGGAQRARFRVIDGGRR